MSGADALALEAYYTAKDDAKRLIGQNLLDKGTETWNRALENVALHIPSEQLNAFQQDFNSFFRSIGDHKALGYDRDADSSEKSDDIDDSDNESSNDSPSADGLAIHQAEHMKLVKRPTFRPRGNISRVSSFPQSPYALKPAATLPPMGGLLFNEDRKNIKRAPTISITELNGTRQAPRTRLSIDDDRSLTPHGDTERIVGSSEEIMTQQPTTSHEPMAIFEPTAGPAADELGSPKGEVQVMRSNSQPLPSTMHDGLLGSKENNDWFRNLKSITHDFIYGKKREFWPNQPVKVAILDSGFALSGEPRKAMTPYSRRIKEKKTFTHEFPSPKNIQEKQRALDDCVGHGTTVAYQLMETCPSAHVYVAKVTIPDSNGNIAVPDKGAVARAIQHAATPVDKGGWGVEIINMSFGWEESELPGILAAEGVSGAIEFASKRGVLLFAAASNYGLTRRNDVLYPARDPAVIAIDAEDGLGNPASFALRSRSGDGGTRYCAPGLLVDSPVSAKPMSGSSFACPVAAGVAALVLEFAKHKDVSLSKSETVKSALSSAQGMLRVFGLMAQQADNHLGFRMLYPWHFLKEGQGSREKVVYYIIDQLEIEFGEGNVGHELSQKIQATVVEASIVQATLVG